MSLEECKRLADERLKKARAHASAQGERRHSTGRVDGEEVEIYLSRNIWEGIDLWPGKPWLVAVRAYYEVSAKHFRRKERADRYFEDLVQKYGLKEEG